MRVWYGAALLIAASISAQEQRRLIVQFKEMPVTRQVSPAAAGAFQSSFARFRADFTTIEAAPATAVAAEARVHREFFRTFHGVSVEITQRESIAAIKKLPYVSSVHPDLEVEAYALHSHEAAPRQDVVTNRGGAGVVVAIIDSGIDYMHPALGGGIGPGRKVAGGYDFVNGDGDRSEEHTSELQSRLHLVCRLLLEKKKDTP